MIRHALSMLFLTAALSAATIDIQSFEADFNQSITDENNHTIVYRGKVWAQRPQTALWRYDEPVNKSVYIRNRTVTMVEPDLEQALIKELGEDIDLMRILSDAKPLADNRYVARFHEREYRIKLEGQALRSIEYLDAFDNRVVLTFAHTRSDIAIDPERFVPSIPKFYDVIRD